MREISIYCETLHNGRLTRDSDKIKKTKHRSPASLRYDIPIPIFEMSFTRQQRRENYELFIKILKWIKEQI